MLVCLGENIRSLRIANGITQEQFGYEMGVSAQAVSRWENGVTYPDIIMLPMIADYFDVSLDYLCERQWNNQIGYVADDRREDMIKISELSDEEFKLVVAYVQAMRDLKKVK